MKPRILIVENDAATALDLEGLLTEAGYFLTGIAASANEAVEMATGSPPNLVLLDIGIAGSVDGIELARWLQESFSLAHICVTGHIEPAVLARANHTNPLGYIVKPYNDAELLIGIEIALCKHGQRCLGANAPSPPAPFVVECTFPNSQLVTIPGEACSMELRCSSHLAVVGRTDGDSLAPLGLTVRSGAAAPESDAAAMAAPWRPE